MCESNVCLPLTSLEEVLEWTIPDNTWAHQVIKKTSRSQICVPASSTDDTSNSFFPSNSVPKTLFCHDMKGGYLEDRLVSGSSTRGNFWFNYWSFIDYFVYFSHKFVTIPPLGWINASHKHGVPILGTVITEGEQGKKIWHEVLSDPEKTNSLCEKLTMIASHYDFDGYLLNIENEINPDQVFLFLDFIKILQSCMVDATLIWYDSVNLPAGNLKYQNKLNGFNYDFFDNCSGIFLNYNWEEDDLALSLRNAKERNRDVFVGVDVFGRGCFGGGGFNCNLAMSAIRQKGLSTALFAPGWIHETCPENESFEKRNAQFWSLLTPFLYVKGPTELPFRTNFCLGFGENMFHEGVVVCKGAWYNLSKQGYQPCDVIGAPEDPDYFITHFHENAYSGGGCLRIKKSKNLTNGTSITVHRLLFCEFHLTDSDVLTLSTATTPLNAFTSPLLCIVFNIRNSDNTICRKLFCSHEEAKYYTALGDFIPPSSTIDVFENTLSTWLKREFIVCLGNVTIVSIGCILGGDQSDILLGEIMISRFKNPKCN